MKCAELEILLSDYLDQTLGPAERTTVESHLSGCPACAELLHDMQAAVAFLERVEAPEPPDQLITRILFHAPVGGRLPEPTPVKKQRGFGEWLHGWISPLLQPRLAMGMAMTILSFSMVGRIVGIPQRQLTLADMEPARVWATVDDKLHRSWDRAVKYYQNLRLVYEIQSRLQEWSAEEELDRKANVGGLIEPSRPAPSPPPNQTKEQTNVDRQNKAGQGSVIR
jgi:hypothetical protein